MYEVLIADDEYYVRKALINLVSWEALGFHVLGEAENGIEALNRMRKDHVDVLIADIRMPKLSGLELIAAAKKLTPSLECLVMSGYDDFIYVKEAMKLGVIDYLQKPVDAREIETTLRALADRLKTSASLNRYSPNQSAEILAHLSYLNMQQRAQHLLQPPVDPAALADAKRYGVVMLCAAAAQNMERFEPWICEKTGLLDEGNALGFTVNALVLPDMPLRICLILSGEQLTAEDIRRTATSFFSGFAALAGTDVSCGYTAEPCDRQRLPEAKQQADTALKSKLLLGKSFISTADLQPPEPSEQEALMNAVIAFREVLTNQDAKSAHLRLLDIFTLPIVHITTLENALRYLYDIICEYRMRYQTSPSELTAQLSSPNSIYIFHSVEQLRNEIIPPILDYFFRNECFLDEHVAVQIQRYVRNNLNGDLHLNTLASLFYLSPNHISFLFKKETGYTISEYIENTRMERAKALLCTSNTTVAEVSAQVGYQNAAYFSRAFKKVTGLSPAQYQARYTIG